MKTTTVTVLTALIIWLSGCTHVQLRSSALHQAEVASQLQQQQVLDNLAMFVVNANAIPFFTSVGAGVVQVNDTGTISASPTWGAKAFMQVGAVFSGSRVNQENLNLTPMTDPYRLRWMRCVYRTAVGAPVDSIELAECSNIVLEWNRSLSSSPDSSTTGGNCFQAALVGPGWFCAKKHSTLSRDPCGRYGDTCISVPPEGTEQLGQLTMAILAIAATHRQVTVNRTAPCPTATPPAPPTGASLPGTNQTSILDSALVSSSDAELLPRRPADLPNMAAPKPGEAAEEPSEEGGGDPKKTIADVKKQNTELQKQVEWLTLSLVRTKGQLDLLKQLHTDAAAAPGSPRSSCTVTETMVFGDAGAAAPGSPKGGGAPGGGAGAAATNIAPFVIPSGSFSIPLPP